MLQLLLKASKVEFQLHDLLADVTKMMTGYKTSTVECQLIMKLSERICKLNAMMVELTATGLSQTNNSCQMQTKPNPCKRTKRTNVTHEKRRKLRSSLTRTHQLLDSPNGSDTEIKSEPKIEDFSVSIDLDDDINDFSNGPDLKFASDSESLSSISSETETVVNTHLRTSVDKRDLDSSSDEDLNTSENENSSHCKRKKINCNVVESGSPKTQTDTHVGTSVVVSHALITNSRSDEDLNQRAPSSTIEITSQFQLKPLACRTIESALDDKIFTLSIPNEVPHLNVLEFLKSAIFTIKDIFEKRSQNQRMFIVYTTLEAQYVRYDEGNEELKTFRFRVRPRTLNTLLCLDEWGDTNIFQPIWSEMSNFQEYTSGWRLKSVLKLTLHCSSYSPLLGTGQGYVNLPIYIKSKKAVVNVENFDNKCFQWAVLLAIQIKNKTMGKHSGRVSKLRMYQNLLNFTGIAFPVAMTDYQKFELQNDNVSINVFTLEKQPEGSKLPYHVIPIYMTMKKKENHANLLLIHDATEEMKSTVLNKAQSASDLHFHYCTISNLSRLMSRQIAQGNCCTFVCDSCLLPDKDYSKHTDDQCKLPGLGVVKLPENDEKAIPFTCNQTTKPFVMYVNAFSSLDESKEGTNENLDETIISIGYFFRSSVEGTRSFYKFDRSASCIDWFCNELKFFADRVYVHLKTVAVPSVPTNEFLVEQCFVCGHDLLIFDDKSPLYCHFTGTFLGLIHSNCHIKYDQGNREIVVVFHGLRQRIVKQLILAINAQIDGPTRLSSSNDRLMFTKHVFRPYINTPKIVRFRFIDSSLWLDLSLNQLVSYLPQKRLKLMRKYFLPSDQLTDKQMQTICALEQGIFKVTPSMMRFAETALPKKSDCPSSIDCEHIKKVWTSFNLKDRGSFVDLCLKGSVLLLADVFENFRQACQQNFHLDATNYQSVSDLAWNSMIKKSGARPELLTDMEQISFVNKGMRGGVVQCSHPHAKANYPEMGDQYDPQLPVDNLLCLRANDLYGSAMMECLPESHFEWHTPADIDVLSIPDDSPEGFLLEVDLEYPKSLHGLHSDYPFCAERLVAPDTTHKKLILSLANKSNYVLHYRTLKIALQNGLILRKVHRCLKFQQSPWMKPFIDFNQKYFTESTRKFDKFISELMVRSVFEKLLEDPWTRSSGLTLRRQWPNRYGIKTLIASPYFESRVVLDETNVAVELRNSTITYNTPLMVGMTVLELAKCVGYKFHYEFMLKQSSVQDSVRLLYVDSDTLIYRIRDQNVFETVQSNLSTYKTTSSLDRFKSIFSTTRILDFDGKQGKMYSISLSTSNKTNKTESETSEQMRDHLWSLKRI